MDKKNYKAERANVKQKEIIDKEINDSLDIETKEEAPVEINKIYGVVMNCSKLNVRKAPSTNAGVVGVVDCGSELVIDMKESNDEWLKVCSADCVEGFCMRKFVSIK